MPIRGSSHVTFAVSDVGRSIAFYRDVLGFRLLLSHARGAYFLAGDLWFCLHLDPGATPASGYTHLAFSVDAEAFAPLAARVRASGAREWQQNRTEGASLYFLDPDGHQLELHVGGWRERLAHARSEPWDPSVVVHVDEDGHG